MIWLVELEGALAEKDYQDINNYNYNYSNYCSFYFFLAMQNRWANLILLCKVTFIKNKTKYQTNKHFNFFFQISEKTYTQNNSITTMYSNRFWRKFKQNKFYFVVWGTADNFLCSTCPSVTLKSETHTHMLATSDSWLTVLISFEYKQSDHSRVTQMHYAVSSASSQLFFLSALADRYED